MSDFVCVGRVEDFKEGVIECRDIDDEEVAVVNWQGKIYAFGNACAHYAAPLSGGWVNEANEVACLLHGAVYDMATGICLRGPGRMIARIPSFSVRIEDDNVYVGERHMTPIPREDRPTAVRKWWLPPEEATTA